MKDNRIEVRLTTSLKLRLKAAAKKTERTVSQLITDAVIEKLEKLEVQHG